MEPLAIERPQIMLVSALAGGEVHWFKYFGSEGWMPACRSPGITKSVNTLEVAGLRLTCRKCQAEFDKLYHPDTAASH